MRAAATATLRTLPRALRLRDAFGWLRSRVAALSPRAQVRLLAALAAVVALSLLYYGWFRDSSLVEVRDVEIKGVTSTDAPRIRARLTHAAQAMTTLHVDEEALRRAIGPGIAVADLRIETDFPHGIRIEVVEHPPVAVLVAPGERVAVAADGTLLPKVKASGVPTIVVGALPNGPGLGRGRALSLVGVAAAAPRPLRERITRIRRLPAKGLVAYLRRGPQVILGDGSALAAKWAAAATVLADGASRGASYVDVRFPDRPVAGGVDVPQPESQQPPAGAAAQPGTVAGQAAPGGATGAAGPAPVPGQPQAPAPATQPQPAPQAGVPQAAVQP